MERNTVLDPRVRLGVIAQPQPVYFFKRRDGSVFACDQVEAHATYKKQQVFGFEYLGMSNGQKYYDVLIEEQKRQQAYLDKIPKSRREAALEKLQRETLAILKVAMDAEIEVARGNLVPPPNTDLQVEGQASPFIQKSLSRLVG